MQRKSTPAALAALALMLGAGTAWAADGERVEQRFDRKGDRIEQHLDRKGDRIDRHLDRRGDRIDHRLDRAGRRAGRHVRRNQ